MADKSAYGRYTPPKSVQQLCPVCAERPADTKEDLLPKWGRKRIAKLGTYANGQLPSVLMPLCLKCNRAYGKLYENDAALIIGPMVDGQSRQLSPTDQEVIGRWVIKSSLLYWLGARRCHRPIGFGWCKRSCEACAAARRRPTSRLFVSATPTRASPDGDVSHPGLHHDGRIPETMIHGTATLGYFAWEIAVGAPELFGSYVESCEDNDALIRVWPPQMTTLSWPPPRSLTTRDIYSLRLAWQSGVWPPDPERPPHPGAWDVARTVPAD